MLHLSLLDSRHTNQLQLLMEQCADYLTFQDEAPLSPSAAADFLQCPEEINPEQRFIYSIQKGSAMIGITELVEKLHSPHTLSLALLVLAPPFRNQSLGSEVLRQIEHLAASRDLSIVRLGVLDGNDRGLIFWQREGFKETGEVKPYKSKTFKVLEKRLIHPG